MTVPCRGTRTRPRQTTEPGFFSKKDFSKMLTDLIAYLLGWPSNRLMIIDCDGCGRVRVCRRNGSRCHCSDCINRNANKD